MRIIEDGEWSKTTAGSPQGSVISPLLSNVYLHYVFDLWVFDLWVQWWRKQHGRRDVVVVPGTAAQRWSADDFVIGFESHSEAMACLEELRTRFAKFGLELREGKTRRQDAAARRGGKTRRQDAADRVRSFRDRTPSRTLRRQA